MSKEQNEYEKNFDKFRFGDMNLFDITPFRELLTPLQGVIERINVNLGTASSVGRPSKDKQRDLKVAAEIAKAYASVVQSIVDIHKAELSYQLEVFKSFAGFIFPIASPRPAPPEEPPPERKPEKELPLMFDDDIKPTIIPEQKEEYEKYRI